MTDNTEEHLAVERPPVSPLVRAIMAVQSRRRLINRARRNSEEVGYLNIVAMMDMMTILLVFLLKSVSFGAENVQVNEAMTLPMSTSDVQTVEALKIFVTMHEVVVEDKKVAPIQNGEIPAKYVDAKNPYMITDLKTFLDDKAESLHQLQKKHSNVKVEDNLMILADKSTPFKVLMQVMFSATQASSKARDDEKLAFRKFRLTVLREDQM